MKCEPDDQSCQRAKAKVISVAHGIARSNR